MQRLSSIYSSRLPICVLVGLVAGRACLSQQIPPKTGDGMSPVVALPVVNISTREQVYRHSNERWAKVCAAPANAQMLEDYANSFPGTPQAGVALALSYDLLRRGGSLDDLRQFGERNWHREIRDQVVGAIYQRYCDAAERDESPEQKVMWFRDFLDRYPASAEAALALSELHVAAFDLVQVRQSREECEEYIILFPDSPLVNRAVDLWTIYAWREEVDKVVADTSRSRQASIDFYATSFINTAYKADLALAEQELTEGERLLYTTQFNGIYNIVIEAVPPSLDGTYKEVALAYARTQDGRDLKAKKTGVEIRNQLQKLRDENALHQKESVALLRSGFSALEGAINANTAKLEEHCAKLEEQLESLTKAVKEGFSEQKAQLLATTAAIRDGFQQMHEDASRMALAQQVNTAALMDLKEALARPSEGAFAKDESLLGFAIRASGTVDAEHRNRMEQGRNFIQKRRDEQKGHLEKTGKESSKLHKSMRAKLSANPKDWKKEANAALSRALGKGTDVVLELNTPASVSINMLTGAYAVKVEYKGGGAGVIDDDKVKDLERGEWTWPQFDGTRALADATEMIATVGDDYAGFKRASSRKAAPGFAFVATRPFVDWASVETVGRHVVTNVLTEGSTSRNTALEIKQKLLYELNAFYSALVDVGSDNDGEIFAISSGVVTEIAKAALEAAKGNAAAGPELFRRPISCNSGNISATLQWQYVPYWVDYTPGKLASAKGMSQIIPLAERFGLPPAKNLQGRVSLPRHLAYELVVVPPAAQKCHSRLDAIRRQIQEHERSSGETKAELEAEMRALEAEAQRIVKTWAQKRLTFLKEHAFEQADGAAAFIEKTIDRAIMEVRVNPDLDEVLKQLKRDAEKSAASPNKLHGRLKEALGTVHDDVMNAWTTSDHIAVIEFPKESVLRGRLEQLVQELVAGNSARATITSLTLDLNTFELEARADLIHRHQFDLK